MTPELEDKAREEMRSRAAEFLGVQFAWKDMSILDICARFGQQQVEREREWWIERIEQERDRLNTLAEKAPGAPYMVLRQQALCLDDLLTSVRERGGK